jgi:hypothetical protein
MVWSLNSSRPTIPRPASRKPTKVKLTLDSLDERIAPAVLNYDLGVYDSSDISARTANATKNQQVKETTKKNELTMRDPKAGQYQQQYSEQQIKEIAATKTPNTPPQNSFSVSGTKFKIR